MKITAGEMHFQLLNKKIKACKKEPVTIDNCLGQRYIAAGRNGTDIIINGTPGNALGAYLDGCNITVNGNAQDATGDTMNDGVITIYGSSGDATGYAMRGGTIYVRDSAGYRAGIHMKSYMDKTPALIIGGKAGSFLGEYQAGGYIVVLGLGYDGESIVGDFCGTGMHGGRIYLRTDKLPYDLPKQVKAEKATAEDMALINSYITAFCRKFKIKKQDVLNSEFYVLTPDTKNPYKRLYTAN